MPNTTRTSINDIREAQRSLKDIVCRTPLWYSEPLSKEYGVQLYFKLENLQIPGAYKLRGALYKVSKLSHAEREKGLITASAGNHAQGVAYSARHFGVEKQSVIIMSTKSSPLKQEKTKSYGVEVELYGNNFDEANAYAHIEAYSRNKTFIEAFDDWDVIAGQGTIALEILEDRPDVDVVLVPVGGGGLISGLAIAFQSVKRDVRVIGVEAKGAACFDHSLKLGIPTPLPDPPRTIADGIAVRRPGDKTFEIVRDMVGIENIILVDDLAIEEALAVLLNKAKILAEPAGAAAFAPILKSQVADLNPKSKVVVVLSGGNIDIESLMRILSDERVRAGKYLTLRTILPDRPGELYRFLGIIAEMQVNVTDLVTHRAGWPLGKIQYNEVLVELLLEVSGQGQKELVLKALNDKGYPLYTG